MTTFLTRTVVVAACLLVMPIGFYAETASAQSSLKKCPKSQNVRWHNCYGKWSDGKGYTYEGEWQDDKQHGQGTNTFTTGEKYVGEFRVGQPNGLGTLTHGDGPHKGEVYVGEFRDGKMNGQGTYTFPNGEKYIGEFKDDTSNGRGTYTFPTGEEYIGEFKDGKRNGQFTVTFANGDKYVGEFKDDKRNGQFKVAYANGDKYVGEFRDDLFNGQGTYTFANGDKYVGEFKDDKFNGRGTQTFTTGQTYVGEFTDNKRNGQFVATYSDGSKYVGEFKDDKYNGQGTYTFPDGEKYVGEFKDDRFNGQGTFTFSNGSKYVGEFNVGKSNGQFSVTYANGDSFLGGYQSDKRNAQGTYNWKDGSKYIGQWKDGLPTTDGILTNASGSVISGAQYKSAAVYDAEGYMTSPDLLTYSGGTVQQQTVPQTTTEPHSVSVKNNLRRVALVIGNSNYQHSPVLGNPHNDAQAVAFTLNSLGFEVISGLDLSNNETVAKVREFAKSAKTADLSLLYYAGHGLQIAGENYIVPVDAVVEDETALSFELINVSTITNFMGGLDKIGVVLLDACRDNPFSRSLKRSLSASRAASVEQGLAPISAEGGGLFVAFSTAPGDVAADGEGMTNSPFTTALLKHLPTKGLEINTVMTRVKAEVAKMTKNDQRPWTNSDLTTEVYLAPVQ